MVTGFLSTIKPYMRLFKAQTSSFLVPFATNQAYCRQKYPGLPFSEYRVFQKDEPNLK